MSQGVDTETSVRADCDRFSTHVIDTADHVRHNPSGEEWVVAYVAGDRLAWCGWPAGLAQLDHCTLTKKANAEERTALLTRMAAIGETDPRATYARRRLAEQQAAR